MIVVQPDSERVAITTVARVGHAVRALGGIGRIVAICGLFLVAIVSITATQSVAHSIFLGVSGWLLVGAAVVDVREFRLPNRLLALAALAALTAAIVGGETPAFLGCLLGGLVCGSMMLVVHVRRGVGMGDVKASTVVGMGCGSVALVLGPLAIAAGALTAAVIGLVTHRSRLALGPSLLVGWIVVLGTKGWWMS